MILLRDEIEKREEEDPDKVYEVPIEADELSRDVVFGNDGLALVPQARQHSDDENADDDVDGVETGHQEVEAEEDLGRSGAGAVEVLRHGAEGGTRDEVLMELNRPLLGELDD